MEEAPAEAMPERDQVMAEQQEEPEPMQQQAPEPMQEEETKPAVLAVGLKDEGQGAQGTPKAAASTLVSVTCVLTSDAASMR